MGTGQRGPARPPLDIWVIPPKKKLIPPIRFTIFVLPEQCASQGVSHHSALACGDGINPKAAVGDTALDVVLFLNTDDKH